MHHLKQPVGFATTKSAVNDDGAAPPRQPPHVTFWGKACPSASHDKKWSHGG
ncbi:MAG: hypothetical protein ABI114_18210 [Rhodanobacter sp.]